MSVTETISHPAFYHSKKRIWDFPITSPASVNSSKALLSRLSIFCVGGFEGLWKLWYAIFTIISTTVLFWLAVKRYMEFKAQAFNPQFGLDWNWTFPLNLQVACLVVVVSILPLMVYAAVSRVGHSANDGIVLGRDCLHLHAMLAQLPCFRLSQSSADPEAAGHLRAQIARSTQSLNGTTFSPDFESFIIQDSSEALERSTWCLAAKRQLRPFSCLIHVIVAFAFFLPVCVFEAEQIKNEAMPPEYAWHSNLNWLLYGFRGVSSTNLSISANISSGDVQMVPGERRAPSDSYGEHVYPSTPLDLSPEYVILAITLLFLTVRFAAPFWFTNRSFSLLLSNYTAISACYSLVEAASLELLIKISTAGARDPFGNRVDIIPLKSQLLSNWICILSSAIGFLAIIAGLMAFYSLGELLFKRAVTNYANLIISGEFEYFRSSLGETKASIMENVAVEEGDLLGPSVIAVTTKVWRPVRRSLTLMGPSRVGTPSGLSASCDTLRSKTTSTFGNKPNIIGKSKNLYSSITFWPSVISVVSFGCLALTRSCLMGPMLQCYWHSKIKLPLFYVIFSIFYLIIWLVLWFGTTAKTAWRFRLLHMPTPSRNRPRFTSPKHRSNMVRMGLATSQFAPWPLMNNPAAAQLGASYFWPWIHYHSGFMSAQNGSLAFGASPATFEGMNSMYGGYVDSREPNPGGLLREGPPTLSDESDNAIQMEYDRPSNYAYLQKGAGLVTIRDGERGSEESYQPYKRNGNDPAYVSLASLGRAGTPQRSSQGGSRRGVIGARVTFKSADENGPTEGNNASSDSGVCTNGSGNRAVGQMNTSNHPFFFVAATVASDRAVSPQGFIGEVNENGLHSPVRLESDDRLCSQV